MNENAGATRALARYARDLKFESLTPEATEVARHCLLDSIGCALAGSSEELVNILVSNVVHPEGSSSARLLGRVEHASTLTAALVNGAMAHALDYDDTHMRMFGHPTVPVIPALLAISESENLSGKDLLVSLIAGVEVETRLGALLNPEHYSVGFHATGTIGSIGAAAAAAHALRLDEERFCHALALGATQAAGLKASFGSMAKPLHAGCAAQSGLMSALLARGGFTGNPKLIETEQGFAAALHGEGCSEKELERFENQFLIEDTLFKYHAACYLTHAAIDASRQLVMEGVKPQNVVSVEVKISPELFKVCTISNPKTGLEGKFSVRATVAMALLDIDTSDLRSYTDQQMSSDELIKLRDKITVTGVDELTTTQAQVIIQTDSGQTESFSDAGIPNKDLDEQWARLSSKFDVLAGPVVGTRAKELYKCIENIEGLESARDLLDYARPKLA